MIKKRRFRARAVAATIIMVQYDIRIYLRFRVLLSCGALLLLLLLLLLYTSIAGYIRVLYHVFSVYAIPIRFLDLSRRRHRHRIVRPRNDNRTASTQ